MVVDVNAGWESTDSDDLVGIEVEDKLRDGFAFGEFFVFLFFGSGDSGEVGKWVVFDDEWRVNVNLAHPVDIRIDFLLRDLFEGRHHIRVVLGNAFAQKVGKIRELHSNLIVSLFLDLDKESAQTHG